MSVNFSLLFYLKKQKNYRTGPAPVYLRITVNGLRAELATGRECEPDRWNASAGRAAGTKAASKSLNAYLDSLQVKVYRPTASWWKPPGKSRPPISRTGSSERRRKDHAD